MKTYYSPHLSVSVPPPARPWAELVFVLGCVGVICCLLWLTKTSSRSAQERDLTVAHSQTR